MLNETYSPPQVSVARQRREKAETFLIVMRCPPQSANADSSSSGGALTEKSIFAVTFGEGVRHADGSGQNTPPLNP